MEKTFKILSINGGGIKGLYSVAVLAKFEELSGLRIIDCFDLITGTSTGGIIALLLAADYGAKDIVHFYSENAVKIFPSKNPLIAVYKQICGKNIHKNDSLKEVLSVYLYGKKLKDAKTYLCIPAIDADNEAPMVFKTGHSPEYTRDPETLMVDVALATSAAPTFLPKYYVKGANNSTSRNCIDGGIWANDPSLVGAIEALKHFVGTGKYYDKFSLLSIGNVECKTGCFSSMDINKVSKILFVRKLIEFFMLMQEKSACDMTKQLAKSLSSDYYLIKASSFSPKEYSKIQMDTNDKNVLESLVSKGYSDAERDWGSGRSKEFIKLKEKKAEV